MSAHPLVTVVVPVFQAENFLDRCINSLISQTYTNMEILLIDDGSTDGSYEICRKWNERDTRIKALHHCNKGVSYTRNRGIERAEGELIIFLDSDDTLRSGAIENMTKHIQNMSADLCICGYEEIFENGGKTYIPRKTEKICLEQWDKGIFWDLFDRHILHNIGTKMYRKSVLERNKIRFREGYVIYEDIIFCLEYMKAVNSIATVSAPYYQYRHDNDNSVTKGYKKGFLENALVLNEMLAEMISDQDECFYKNVLRNIYPAYINEFMDIDVKKERIADWGRELCGNKYIRESRGRVTLAGMPKDAKVFYRLLWHRQYTLLYCMGLWKRLRRRKNEIYEKTDQILLEK